MLKKYGMLAAVGLGAVIALVYFAKKGAAAAAQVATTKLNPYADTNVVYQNVIGGAGKAVTGDSGWTLGGAIYDLFNKPYTPQPVQSKGAVAAITARKPLLKKPVAVKRAAVTA